MRVTAATCRPAAASPAAKADTIAAVDVAADANPTAKALKMMGAKGISKILYKAKEIYDAHRAELFGTEDQPAEELAQ